MLAPPPALRHRDFRRLWTSILCSGIAMQMAQVAIGWQVYSIRHNAFDLGLIGLAEFVPVPLLALPAGQLADRLPRVDVVMVTSLGDAARRRAAPRRHAARRARALAVRRARRPDRARSSALGSPAQRSLTPELVPAELLTAALALRSIARPGGDDRRPGARRVPLRGAAGGGVRRRRGAARRLRARAPAGHAPGWHRRWRERREPAERCSRACASSAGRR